MRITIDGFGRRLLDLELFRPLRKPGPPTAPGGDVPGCDPRSTVAAQVEQAGEPSPGFGFRGSTSTVICESPPGGGGGGSGGSFSGGESVRITVT